MCYLGVFPFCFQKAPNSGTLGTFSYLNSLICQQN